MIDKNILPLLYCINRVQSSGSVHAVHLNRFLAVMNFLVFPLHYVFSYLIQMKLAAVKGGFNFIPVDNRYH